MAFTDLETNSQTSAAYAIASAVDVPTVITDQEGVVLAVTDPPPPGFDRILPEINISVQFDGDSKDAVRAAIDQAVESGVCSNFILVNSEERELIIFRAGTDENALYLWQDALAREEHSRLLQKGLMHTSLLRGFAHEARNPLHAITGFAECLMNPQLENLTTNQKEYCQSILDAAKHILWLSDQLLDYSKLDSGSVNLELAPVDIHDVIEKSSALVRDFANKKGIVFHVEESHEVFPTIFADGRRLLSVIVNLLSNAIKFTPRGGRVELQTLVDDTNAYFIVSDTGIGIDPSHHQRIFEPYERSENGDHESSAGIGLALAKKIVEMHCGEISVASEAGCGSQFIVKMPLLPYASKLLEAANNVPTRRSGRESYHWGGLV
ncbi:MAG: sensor histidine kinase [Planctomycetota bacterium]